MSAVTRRRTRGEAAIESQLRTMDPKSERYRVLSAARDFKASWVELGDLLTRVREDDAYREWGYANFDAYCRRELRIKQDTANKLTRSYAFLRDHEPEALEERTERELPPLDVVDLLSRARERAKLTDRQFDDIRHEVFDPETPVPTRGQVLKKFRAVDPEAFKSAPKAKTVGAGDADLRKTMLLAERLQALLEALEGTSREARSAIRTVVTELRDRFEEGQKQQSA